MVSGVNDAEHAEYLLYTLATINIASSDSLYDGVYLHNSTRKFRCRLCHLTRFNFFFYYRWYSVITSNELVYALNTSSQCDSSLEKVSGYLLYIHSLDS